MTLRFFLLVLAGIAALAPPVSAQDLRSLRGIRGVYVLVEPLPDGALRMGLTDELIQTDVELKLRLAGMRVLTEPHSAPGFPLLVVNCNVTNKGTAADVIVALEQDVRLSRDLTIEVIGVWTWEDAVLLAYPTSARVRDSIKDLVDKFLNAWLMVNPK